MQRCCAVLVCLSTCGHGSGNGTPCAGRAICASFDPLGVYIYAVGVESCATRLPLLRSVPLPTRTVAALGTLGSSARCSGSRPHSRFLRRRSRRLRGDTRRNASSPGYRLLALRRVSPRIRRTASPHVAQFGTRPLVPCLTFQLGAFFLPVADVSRFRPHRNLISPRLISARKFRYNMPNAVENEESERKHQNGR